MGDQLQAMTALGARVPAVVTVGPLTITERFDVALASVATRRGKTADLTNAAKAIGLPLPGPARHEAGAFHVLHRWSDRRGRGSRGRGRDRRRRGRQVARHAAGNARVIKREAPRGRAGVAQLVAVLRLAAEAAASAKSGRIETFERPRCGRVQPELIQARDGFTARDDPSSRKRGDDDELFVSDAHAAVPIQVGASRAVFPMRPFASAVYVRRAVRQDCTFACVNSRGSSLPRPARGVSPRHGAERRRRRHSETGDVTAPPPAANTMPWNPANPAGQMPQQNYFGTVNAQVPASGPAHQRMRKGWISYTQACREAVAPGWERDQRSQLKR